MHATTDRATTTARAGTTDRAALAALVARMAARDEDALAKFYDATCAQAYRLALLLAGAPEPATHLCRIAYLRAFREAPRYDAGCWSPTAWLLALTHEVGTELSDAA
ncbi:MAG TPA: hypothetical protein VNS46_08395 [Nocardioides sp.]|nr:hypothetical protein [Nocardioides sp.]